MRYFVSGSVIPSMNFADLVPTPGVEPLDQGEGSDYGAVDIGTNRSDTNLYGCRIRGSGIGPSVFRNRYSRVLSSTKRYRRCRTGQLYRVVRPIYVATSTGRIRHRPLWRSWRHSSHIKCRFAIGTGRPGA